MFLGLTFFGIPITWFLRGLELVILLILVVGIYLMIKASYYSLTLQKRKKKAKILQFKFPSNKI